MRKLKRRLTFDQVDEQLLAIEQQLYQGAYLGEQGFSLSVEDLLQQLEDIQQHLLAHHNALFVDEVQDFIRKVRAFGFHFACLDVRQDSRVHHKVMCELAEQTDALPTDYADLQTEAQLKALSAVEKAVSIGDCKTDIAEDTLKSIAAIQTIQQLNGEAGANRYIISNCQSALNVMEVLAFFKLGGWTQDQVSVDIIPLFETITDLSHAPQIMRDLFANPELSSPCASTWYAANHHAGVFRWHQRWWLFGCQLVDFKGQGSAECCSTSACIRVVFFDGRGGPPARGGGETHKFYASLSNEIENSEIQLTVQGQTISCNFGTVQSARYNLEQLLSAGLSTAIRDDNCAGWRQQDRELLDGMANTSLQAYEAFKQDPKFIPYLEKISTLPYYSKTNIGVAPESVLILIL